MSAEKAYRKTDEQLGKGRVWLDSVTWKAGAQPPSDESGLFVPDPELFSQETTGGAFVIEPSQKIHVSSKELNVVGSVFRTRDADSAGHVVIGTDIQRSKNVAVKIMNPWEIRREDGRLKSPSLVKKETSYLFQEYFLTKGLSHPNIVEVHDLVSTVCDKQRVPGYTMEQLNPLGRSSLTANEVGILVAQIAGALDYCASQDVTHYDVKPENVMRREDGTFVLTDFGVAQTAESTAPLARSPNFGDPLQNINESRYTLPDRADQYGLAVTAFAFLKGFPEKKWLWQSEEGGPHTRLITEGRTLPASVMEVIQKAIHPDRAQRFGSSTEFAQALQQAIHQMPDAEKPPRNHSTLDLISMLAKRLGH